MKKKVSFAAILFFSFALVLGTVSETRAQTTPNSFSADYLPGGFTYNSPSQNVGLKRFAGPDGISVGFVAGITQDPKGFMWFGATGLYRYDGYHLTAYTNDPLN